MLTLLAIGIRLTQRIGTLLHPDTDISSATQDAPLCGSPNSKASSTESQYTGLSFVLREVMELLKEMQKC